MIQGYLPTLPCCLGGIAQPPALYPTMLGWIPRSSLSHDDHIAPSVPIQRLPHPAIDSGKEKSPR